MNMPKPKSIMEQRDDTRGLCVVAAAILQDNKIWSVPAPGRHNDVIRFMSDCGVKLTAPWEDHGFMLSNGKFCLRPGAKRVAIAAGQFTERAIARLFTTEDIW